ncbi:MAG: DUF2442 domain-containing protein [Deltaproteobacteria bacterium]|nr:DUF2442 domain-containing protein [Deltaproteobacteria bacterium]
MDKIIKAIPLENYQIEILTSSGISGIFDVKPYLGGGAFRELVNESYFRMVRPAHHGIAWPREQDFSADTIIWDIKNAQQDAPADAQKRRG